MPKITAIKRQKNSERVNLYADGEFLIGINGSLIIDFDLYAGKELTEKEITIIKESDNLAKCLEKAYRLLSFRPRSEQELTARLLEKFDSKIVGQALINLKKYNYINDESFAEMWIRDRKQGRGKKVLFMELRKKGISEETIKSLLAQIADEQEYEAAKQLVSSKKKYQGLSREDAYKKIGGFLARRGFSYDIIKRIINGK